MGTAQVQYPHNHGSVVGVRLYIPKSTTGMSVRHSNITMVWVCWCFKPTKPIPSAPTKKTNSKPQRSDPGWSTALSLQHQVHTHTSKQHRTVKTAMSCWDFYTRVLVGQIPALSSVALEEFCWRKQQRNILCRAAPNTLLQRLTQSLTPDRKWEPSEPLQIFISLPWNKISSGFLLNRNSKY